MSIDRKNRSPGASRRHGKTWDAAITVARDAFDYGPWRWMSVAERVPYLLHMADYLDARGEQLAQTATLQNGTPISMTRAAASRYGQVIRNCVEVAASYSFSEERAGVSTQALVTREPVGVVAAIVPWNGPLIISLVKSAPALLAGCSVILKPPPETPLDTYILAEAALTPACPLGSSASCPPIVKLR